MGREVLPRRDAAAALESKKPVRDRTKPRPSKWTAERANLQEEQSARMAREAVIKRYQDQARKVGKAAPNAEASAKEIKELSIRLLEVTKTTKSLADEAAALQKERDHVLDEAQGTASHLSALEAEGQDVTSELQRLSQLEQVQSMRQVREATRAAVSDVVAKGDASLLQGVQEWLTRHKLEHGAASAVLRWCADNAFASVYDILGFLQDDACIDAFVGALGTEGGQAAQLKQSLQRELKDTYNTKAMRNSQKRKRQDGGAALVKKITESLSQCQQRIQSLEQLVDDGIKDARELEQAQTEARQLQCRLRKAQAASKAIWYGWVIASTPMKGPDGSDVFGVIKALYAQYPELSVGCDWPGSPTAQKADTAAFDSIFSPGGLCQKWVDGGMSERVLNDITEVIFQTLWWQLYKGGVKGALRITALSGNPVRVVCIEGGPISRVEARRMQMIADEVALELSVLGKSEAEIEVVHFKTIDDFKRVYLAQEAMCSKFEEQADQPRQPEARPSSSASVQHSDVIFRRWRASCEQLHHANEHLWHEIRQSGPKPNRPPSEIVMLQLEADKLWQQTTALQDSLRPRSSGAMSSGGPVCMSRTTSLPSLRVR